MADSVSRSATDSSGEAGTTPGGEGNGGGVQQQALVPPEQQPATQPFTSSAGLTSSATSSAAPSTVAVTATTTAPATGAAPVSLPASTDPSGAGLGVPPTTSAPQPDFNEILQGLRRALPLMPEGALAQLAGRAVKEAAEMTSPVSFLGTRPPASSARPSFTPGFAPFYHAPDPFATRTTLPPSLTAVPTAAELEATVQELERALDQRINTTLESSHVAERELKDAEQRAAAVERDRRNSRPSPVANPSQLQLSLLQGQEAEYAHRLEVVRRQQAILSRNHHLLVERLHRYTRIKEYLLEAKRAGPPALHQFVQETAPRLLADAAQWDARDLREDPSVGLTGAGLPFAPPQTTTPFGMGARASGSPYGVANGNAPPLLSATVGTSPATSSSAPPDAQREDTSWQRYFSPTAIPITLDVGATTTSRRQFEQAAEYNRVPTRHWVYALRKCLTAEQQGSIINVRKDPVTGEEKVHTCGEMSYNEIWDAIQELYDNPSGRADAMMELANMPWEPQQTPREFATKLLKASQRTSNMSSADASLLKSYYFAAMAQPLKQLFHQMQLMREDWNRMVDRTQDLYASLNVTQKDTFCANLTAIKSLHSATAAAVEFGATAGKRARAHNLRTDDGDMDLSDDETPSSLAAITPTPTKSTPAAAKPKGTPKKELDPSVKMACWGCSKEVARGELTAHKSVCVPWLKKRLEKLKKEGKPHDQLQARLEKLRGNKKQKSESYDTKSSANFMSGMLEHEPARVQSKAGPDAHCHKLQVQVACASPEASKVAGDATAQVNPEADPAACEVTGTRNHLLSREVGTRMLAAIMCACCVARCNDHDTDARADAKRKRSVPCAASTAVSGNADLTDLASDLCATPRDTFVHLQTRKGDACAHDGEPDVTARPLRVAELCCGVGGVHRGLEDFARHTGVKAEVVLAVDRAEYTCEAYKHQFPGTEVLCADIASPAVLKRLKQLEPDAFWVTAPCVDFSPSGKGVEGEAASVLPSVAQLAVNVRPKLVFHENVPRMLLSGAWGCADGHMRQAGYSTFEVQFRGTDVDGGSSRERIYTVSACNTQATPARFARLNALLNERFRSSTPKTVRDCTGCMEDTFYWDPRQPHRAGVLSTDMPLPSPVTRQPGKGPTRYVQRAKDAGPAKDALILSPEQVMECLGYHEPYPEGTLTQRRKWAADLVQPAAVSALMQCVHAVASLPNCWERPAPAGPDVTPGEVTVHDHTAPPPEWVVDASQPALLRIAGTCSSALGSAANWCWEKGRAFLASLRQGEPVQLNEVQWQRGDDESDSDSDSPRVTVEPAVPQSTATPKTPMVEESANPDSDSATPLQTRITLHELKPRWAARGKAPMPLHRVTPVGRPRKNGFVHMTMRTQVGDAVQEFGLDTLVDCGAEAEFINKDSAHKLPPGTICPLADGDFTTVELADAKKSVPVEGVVHAQVRFKDHLLTHRFYVVDLPYQAILGSNFFGKYGSVISYEHGMKFYPAGSSGPAVPMRERARVGALEPPEANSIKIGSARVHTKDKPVLPERKYLLRAASNQVIDADTAHTLEVVSHPPLQCTGPVEVLLTPDVPEAVTAVNKLAEQGVVLLDSVDTAMPNKPLRLMAENTSTMPVLIRKGAILGAVEAPEMVCGLDVDQETLTANLTRIALSRLSSDPPTVNQVKPSSDPTATTQAEAERTAHRRKVAEEHNATLELCTDEELADVLKRDGKVIPMLEERDKDGVKYYDRVMEVLRRRRAAFAKDPKNPRVTDRFDVDIDTGDAAPIADKARRWAEREAKIIFEAIQDERKRGQIRPASGPWASNPVLVTQKGKIRFCVDYRPLNKVTRRDEYGLGNMDDLVQKVASSRIFSALDFASGYRQIPMTKESSCKTAFRGHLMAHYGSTRSRRLDWCVCPAFSRAACTSC